MDSNTIGNTPVGPIDPALLRDASAQSAPRKRLREIRDNGKPRAKRQKRVAQIPVDQAESGRIENLLSRETRWITFLYHSTHMELEVMRKVFGEGITADSPDYRYGHFKICDSVKAFKNHTLGYIEVGVFTDSVAALLCCCSTDSVAVLQILLRYDINCFLDPYRPSCS